MSEDDMRMLELPHMPKTTGRSLYVSKKLWIKRKYETEEDVLRNRRYQDQVEIPVVPSGCIARESDRRATLLAAYTAIHDGWRALTDVRFKLLGFLPLVSGTVLITLLSNDGGQYRLAGQMQALVGLFGLTITLGLIVYDTRNSALYNDLVGRGRQIEAELGIHTGHFRGRPKGGRFIKHGTGLKIIYTATVAAWLTIIIHGAHRAALLERLLFSVGEYFMP